ncbi:beta-1,3-glucanase family protein [Xanthobacter sediminis]
MRTWFIRTITSAIAATGCAAGAHAANPASLLPVTITNQTGYTGTIYVTVYGSTNPAQNGTWYYVSSAGAATKFTPSKSKTPQYKSYGFSFKGKSASIKVPMLQSARVYFSFCSPVMLSVDDTGRPSTPDGWTIANNKNFSTLFDFAEYTWIPNTGAGGGTQIWVDTTQVDAFALPIRMALTGKPGGKTTHLTGGFDSPTAGPSIITAMTKAGAPWKSLIINDSKKQPIRIISPVHAMLEPTSSPYYFKTNYWDSYINSVFKEYAKPKTSFSINTGAGIYTGVVKNNQMVLTPKGGGTPTVFGKPTSQYLWGNGAPPISGGNVATLQKYIQAAFLRSTFLTNNNLSACNAKPYTSAPINQYSKLIHQYAYQQEAYTFPYDDVCSQSSTISLLQPTSLNLTLFPITTTMPKMTCP